MPAKTKPGNPKRRRERKAAPPPVRVSASRLSPEDLHVAAFLRQARNATPSQWAARALPGSSLAHGRAGLAFFYVEHFRLTGDARSLRHAEEHVVSAARLAESSPAQAFDVDDGEPPSFSLSTLGAGMLTGWGGIGYTTILVGAARADDTLRSAGESMLLRAYEQHKKAEPRLTELFFGTAGYLAAADDLERRGIASAPVRAMGDEAAALLVDDIARPVDRGSPLGAAHGRAGELWVLVRRGTRVPERIRAVLEAHRVQAKRAGACMLWPFVSGGPVPGRVWSSFCSGVVGHALLFADASRVYDDPRYREAADGAATSLRSIDVPDVATLCCGMAGQAVALERVGRVTDSTADRRAAGARLRTAQIRGRRLDALSLLQGRAGIAWMSLLRAHRQPLFVPLLYEPKGSLELPTAPPA